MPHIIFHIDKKTLEKVEKAAKKEGISIPKWMRKQLKKSLKNNYTADFKNLFGSINDTTFAMPPRTKV